MSSTVYGVPGSPRLPWSDLPAPVRDAVESYLGSAVVHAVTQPGGFSTGTAARVECADGRAESCRAPTPATMPTIRTHQRRFHDAALAWGRRRWDWE